MSVLFIREGGRFRTHDELLRQFIDDAACLADHSWDDRVQETQVYLLSQPSPGQLSDHAEQIEQILVDQGYTVEWESGFVISNDA